MPPQLREIGFHVQNHATQWHGFQHEIQFQEIVVAWIQLTPFDFDAPERWVLAGRRAGEVNLGLTSRAGPRERIGMTPSSS